MLPESIVYIVDDDESIRESLRWVCTAADLECICFPSLKAFMEYDKPALPSCVVLDLCMGNENGLEIVEAWKATGQTPLPVIIVTGTGDVPLAVKSIKLGMMDFLEKPVDPNLLVGRIQDALAADTNRRENDLGKSDLRNRLKDLTRRERELLKLVCGGFSNKQIATQLAISIKTVANHRAHLLAKAKAVNTADMVRLAVMAGQV